MSEYLECWVEILAGLIDADAEYPGRPELLARLEAIENACRLLLSEIDNNLIRKIIFDGDARTDIQRAIRMSLPDLADHAAQLIAQNPPGPGRGRIEPKQFGVGPEVMCALMIGTRWELKTGRWPPKANPRAHDLCERLWRAAGGAEHVGRADGQSAYWHSYIKAAREYRATPAGQWASDALVRMARQSAA